MNFYKLLAVILVGIISFIPSFYLNFAPNSALAADLANPYMVEDVAVNVMAKSPSEARNLALKTVRRDALQILFARLGVNNVSVARISDDEVSDMVRSEQIVDEKIAGGSYSASFNIVFAKDFVDHILAQKKLNKEEPKSLQPEKESVALIVPIKILQRKTLLWESGNDWRASINKALDGDSGFKIPVADDENMSIIRQDNVSKINAGELSSLFAKYQSGVVYFLFFTRDVASGNAVVSLRSVGVKESSGVKLSFVNTEGFDEYELMQKVATKTVEYLKNLKSATANIEAKKEQIIAVEIPIAKLGDWLMIKNKIEASGIVNKLSIETISRDYVKATIFAAASDAELSELFSRAGFSLTLKSENIYLLTLK